MEHREYSDTQMVLVDKLQIHEAANLFPEMGEEEIERLAADIKDNGMKVPIVLDDHGKVIDGRNRLRACKLLNRKTVEALSYSAGGDAIIRFVISENLHRRHLTESQRADIAARLAGGLHGSDRSKAHICALTQAEAAKQLGVSERSLQNARFVHQHGIGSLRTALAQGAVPVSAAWREAGQPASRCTSTWDTTR
jgi:ParB/RepB/Spo0J family partition protein